MTVQQTEQAAEIQSLLQRAKLLRKALAATAAQVDAQGKDPQDAFQQIWQAGLYRLSLPQIYGGLSDGTAHANCTATIAVLTDLSAAEGSTGMLFMVQTALLRLLLGDRIGLPETTRQQLAREVVEENARFVASNAETGTSGRVTARKVDGGIVLNGTKTFNTGSGGARYAHVTHVLEGEPGRHAGLVRLDRPGVILHHDWDTMGQRATESQTITYQDVFVPDGWHYAISGGMPRTFFPFALLMQSAVMLGIGLGGFDAMLEYVRMHKRSLTPQWKDGTTDPLVRLRIGSLSTHLAAAHALQREVSRHVEQLNEGDDPDALIADALRAKVASIEAALKTTNELFELTGARSTSNAYRLDRFWRNARTFSVHDPSDAALLKIGGNALTGEPASVLPSDINV